MATIPILELCMNSMGAIFMDVQTVRKTKMIWVKRGKCTPRPRKNISVPKVTIWGSYGNMNSSHKRNWTLNWNTLFDNGNHPSIASILGWPKNQPSSMPCWMTLFFRIVGSGHSCTGSSSLLLWRNATPFLQLWSQVRRHGNLHATICQRSWVVW